MSVRIIEEMELNGRLKVPVRLRVDGDSAPVQYDIRLQLLGVLQNPRLSQTEKLQHILRTIEEPSLRKVNVHLRSIDLESGEVAQEIDVHNIVVNTGREWHRNLMSCNSYPATHTVVLNSNENLGGASVAEVDCSAVAEDNHRPRYIAVGVGGTKQIASPPGAGSLYEVTTVNGLELPVQVTGSTVPYYAKQVDAQVVGDEDYYPDYFPSAYAVRYRTLFDDDEISFASQPTYGTSVPISEYLLLTSAADRSVSPAHADPGLGFGGPGVASVDGVCAYCTAATIVKTPLNGLEVVWEFRT